MAYFLAPSLVRLRSEVNALWPRRSKASDGWIGDTAHSARKSDHNPDYSAGGIVRAIDVTNAGIDVDAFVSSVIRDVRTRYVITRGRIWTREAGWRKYTGPNGHHHHVHISVRSTKSPRYDLQAHAWGLSKTVGNNLGGGGSVATPNIPGAPAPITPEDDMFSDEDRETLQLVRRIVAENQRRTDKGIAISTENQRRIDQVKTDVWNVSVKRDGKSVPVIQELADAKTLSAQARGEADGLRAALTALAAGKGLTVEQITEAARVGAVQALKGGVKVTIDIPKEG